MDNCRYCGSPYGTGYSCKHYINKTPTKLHPFNLDPKSMDRDLKERFLSN